MKKIISIIIIALLFSCSGNYVEEKNEHENDTVFEKVIKASIVDSSEISKSEEYLKLIEFLNWYKDGHQILYMPRIQKVFRSDSIYYEYIDSSEAQELLNIYRESGYFSENYLKKDSLFIERAKEEYKSKDLEVYDFFDHDFILLTQEIEGTLNAISNTYILPDFCELDSGKIAVSIGDYMNLKYTFIRENGKLKINSIENLGGKNGPHQQQ